MKTLAVIVLCLWVDSAAAPPDLWQHARRQVQADGWHPDEQVQPVSLTGPQQAAVIRLLKTREDVRKCLPEDPTFFEDLRYETVPLSPKASVVLVESGYGCLRGGQGSNGAMWLVRHDGAKTTLLATPQEGFAGWVSSIEPTKSKGYRDIILGWHMSSREAGLSYFRFDGKSYRCIGYATLRSDENGHSTIVPKSPSTLDP